MTTLPKTIVTATVAVLVGASLYHARQAAQLRTQVQTLQHQRASLTQKIERTESELTRANLQLSALRDDQNPPKRNDSEVLKLRSENSQLRQAYEELKRLNEDARRLAPLRLGPSPESVGSTNSLQLFSRRIKVNPDTFFNNLNQQFEAGNNLTADEKLKTLFEQAGASSFDPPATFFYSSRGEFMIRNTLTNLDLITRVISMLDAGQ